MLEKIAVMGGGSWGTALSCLVARSIGSSILYTHNNNIVDEINNKHQNSKYLGETIINSGVIASSNIKDIISSDLIILAIPSHALKDSLIQLKEAGLASSTILLVATKGLCINPVQLFSDMIQNECKNPYGFISGPNFAREVAEDKFTSFVISATDIDLAQNIATKLSRGKSVITTSDDIITVQIASIVKNIIAIKSGIMQAKGVGENARAWLVSMGLKEISLISEALGGNLKSITMPSVVGDLVLTCYSTTSRNTKFGYDFHQNNYSKNFLDNYPLLLEGVSSAKSLKLFLSRKKINLNIPVISSIIDIV